MDPNALVRIIPLHSEDSYEGYGEEDLHKTYPPDSTEADALATKPRTAPKLGAQPAAKLSVSPRLGEPPSPGLGAGLRAGLGAVPGETSPRAPGKVRPGRRKVDPNALVRIIPLHSEDSYDGYSEDERPAPTVADSPTGAAPPSPQPPTTPPPTPRTLQPSQASVTPQSPRSPQLSPASLPPTSPQPVEQPVQAVRAGEVQARTSDGGARNGVRGSAGPGDSQQRLPGRPRGPRRKVDPNALVRIIPLHSEDSYEGYGEDDLPAGWGQPEKPKKEGVDVIVDEIDMSKWREPSFEENELVRIIPLKEDVEIPKLRLAAPSKSRPKQDLSSRRSPMMPPEEELVKIIPLHGSDEERSPPSPQPRSPLPSPSVVAVEVQAAASSRSEPVRRRKRSEPSRPPQGDELVKVIPLHSDSESETELAGYAARAAREQRERPRKSSDTRSSRAASRAGSRASSRPGSARSERMEPLQIVSLGDPEAVDDTGVAFARRDLAIQGRLTPGRTTPQPPEWHSHGRTTPQSQGQGQGQGSHGQGQDQQDKVS